MNEYIKSAIIGFYRCGASNEQTSGVTNLDIETIIITIMKYFESIETELITLQKSR